MVQPRTSGAMSWNPRRLRYPIRAATWDFQQCGMCDQQSLRSACAYAQSDQSLCLSLGYSVSVKATDWTPFGVCTLKRMLHRPIWVYTCQNATLLEITCRGSYISTPPTLVTELTLLLYEAAKNRIRLWMYTSKPLLGVHVLACILSTLLANNGLQMNVR